MRLIWSMPVIVLSMACAAPYDDAKPQTLLMFIARLDEALCGDRSSDTDSSGSGDTAPCSDGASNNFRGRAGVPGYVQPRIREDGRAGYAGRRRDIIRREFEARKNAQAARESEGGAVVPYELQQQVCNLTSVWQKQVVAAWIQLRLRGERDKVQALKTHLDQQEADCAK